MNNFQTDLFEPEKVKLGVMAMKGYSTSDTVQCQILDTSFFFLGVEISHFRQKIQSAYYKHLRRFVSKQKSLLISVASPIGWGCRIHRLHHCRGIRAPNECPGYDIKQSDGEAPVMLEFWGMQIIPSLPSFPGLLQPKMVAPDGVLSMGQIKWFEI